jgi:hypothetical protein
MMGRVISYRAFCALAFAALLGGCASLPWTHEDVDASSGAGKERLEAREKNQAVEAKAGTGEQEREVIVEERGDGFTFFSLDAEAPDDAPAELKQLLDAKQPKGVEDDASMRKLRPKAIAEAGQLVGVQSGMSWRYGRLMTETEKYAATLDTSYNFAPLLILSGDAMVLPPILTLGDESMRIEADNAATSALKTYEILEDARFVGTAPHWRSYLMIENFPAPEAPNPVLLPKTSAEKRIWMKAVAEGWSIGVEQADQIYIENMAKLVRDFRGITLFHALHEGQMVQRPKLADSSLGTRVSDRKLHVDQKVYRITAPAIFNADTKQWTPLIK